MERGTLDSSPVRAHLIGRAVTHTSRRSLSCTPIFRFCVFAFSECDRHQRTANSRAVARTQALQAPRPRADCAAAARQSINRLPLSRRNKQRLQRAAGQCVAPHCSYDGFIFSTRQLIKRYLATAHHNPKRTHFVRGPDPGHLANGWQYEVAMFVSSLR